MNKQGVSLLVGVVLVLSMTSCARVRIVEQGRDLATVNRGFSIPLIDLAEETHRQVVVDKEEGQYLGHPTTVLLEDNRTIITVYPKGHGRGGQC